MIGVLELDTSLSGDERATLFAVLDSSITAMGSRALRRWLNRPMRALDLAGPGVRAHQRQIDRTTAGRGWSSAITSR